MSEATAPLTIRGRSLHLEISTLVGPALAAVAGVLIARSLGPEGRGVVAAFVVTLQAIAFVTSLSVDKGLMHHLRHQTDDQPSIQFWHAALWAAIGPIAAAICIGVIWGRAIMPTLSLAIMLGLAAGLAVLLEVISGWALGLGEFRKYSVWRVLQPVLFLGFLLGSVLLTSDEDELILTIAVSYVASALGSSAWLWWKTGRPALHPIRTTMVRKVASYGVQYHFASVANFLNSRLDLLILPFFLPDTLVGLYAVAAAPAALMGAPKSAIIVRGLTGITGVGARVQWLFVVVGIVGICAMPWLLPFVFGAEYSAAVVPSQILVAATICDLPATLVSARLAYGKEMRRASLIPGITVGLLAIGLFAIAFVGSQSLVWVAISVLVSKIVGLLLAISMVVLGNYHTKRHGLQDHCGRNQLR